VTAFDDITVDIEADDQMPKKADGHGIKWWREMIDY